MWTRSVHAVETLNPKPMLTSPSRLNVLPVAKCIQNLEALDCHEEHKRWQTLLVARHQLYIWSTPIQC